jgi:hypothetical protein
MTYPLYIFHNIKPSFEDKLGLKHYIRDLNTPAVEEVITPDLILRLRDLIKQYNKSYA